MSAVLMTLSLDESLRGLLKSTHSRLRVEELSRRENILLNDNGIHSVQPVFCPSDVL